MLTEKEIFQKILKIELYTRFLADQLFSGKYTSSFKGRGVEFSEVRPYVAGDDIRSIDWNITARMNYPYIKEFVEERQLSILLLIDLSASMYFGTGEKLKRELISEVASLLSWTALRNNDKVGLILFTDRIEKYIPPRKGRFHVLRIIREILYFNPVGRHSDISCAMDFASRIFRKKSIMFAFSDFFGGVPEKFIKILSKKHDFIGVRILDAAEEKLPSCGICEIKDTETGKTSFVNFSSPAVRKKYDNFFASESEAIKKIFSSAGCDLLFLRTDKEYIPALLNLFRSRARRR
ncbi:MAG: DUF58 domain-containing protein [Elusimicrobia bacterium CG08_land_8_20_14_0_20_44_26]|nr:MAG: DUF58 domain-containing protein [Elusimicrobia bacterium CG08_land_8_20_14_0_20_44_26]